MGGWGFGRVGQRLVRKQQRFLGKPLPLTAEVMEITDVKMYHIRSWSGLAVTHSCRIGIYDSNPSLSWKRKCWNLDYYI